jgi:hypothetical protein
MDSIQGEPLPFHPGNLHQIPLRGLTPKFAIY